MQANWSDRLDRWLGGRRSRWFAVVFFGVFAYIDITFHFTDAVMGLFAHGVGVLMALSVALVVVFSVYRDFLGGAPITPERVNPASEQRVRTLVRTRGVMPMPPRLRRALPFSASELKRYDGYVDYMRSIPWGSVTPAISVSDAPRIHEETTVYLRSLSGNWSKLDGPINVYARMPAPWCWLGAARIMGLWSYLNSHFYAPTGIRQALYFLAEAQAIEPENLEVLFLRVGLLRFNGDPKRLRLAEQTLQRAQQLAPDDPRLPLAESGLFLDFKRYDLALAAISEATRRARSPEDLWEARKAKANIYLAAGKHGEAAALYRELVNEREQDPWLWRNLSIALLRYQSLQEALYASDKALTLMEFGAARSVNTTLRQRMGLVVWR